MALIDEVKDYLDITWEMTAGEQKKLSGMIERGKEYLQGKIGTCDFESDTREKSLLLDYCMYARAGRIPDFQKNYRSDIIALQVKRWRAKQNAESTG